MSRTVHYYLTLCDMCLFNLVDIKPKKVVAPGMNFKGKHVDCYVTNYMLIIKYHKKGDFGE